MLVCPNCKSRITKPRFACQSCEFEPQHLDGFVAWSPELARNNSGFNPEDFAKLEKVESEYFWFQARINLILWALENYFPAIDSLLEIGCGTGYVLSGIETRFQSLRNLVGSEIYTQGLAFAAKKLDKAELLQMDARKMPYIEEFDVVGAFDALEHILEDELALKNIYSAIKPGGGCIITVPQHKWLWSETDEQACHQRQYSAEELHTKIKKAGFQILRSTSFVSSLLPIMALSRLRKSGTESVQKPDESLEIPRWLNTMFFQILSIEVLLIKKGLNFPFGGSRLVVARKPGAI